MPQHQPWIILFDYHSWPKSLVIIKEDAREEGHTSHLTLWVPLPADQQFPRQASLQPCGLPGSYLRTVTCTPVSQDVQCHSRAIQSCAGDTWAADRLLTPAPRSIRKKNLHGQCFSQMGGHRSNSLCCPQCNGQWLETESRALEPFFWKC